MKYIVILALLFAYVHSRALTACPDLPTPRNFDATKYVGDWYDIGTFV
jgi:lipocalin